MKLRITKYEAASKYPEVPERVIDALFRYVEGRYPTGDFLRSVLSNDLLQTFAYADEENKRVLQYIVEFIYSNLPAECHGSPRKVAQWLSHKETEEAK